VRLRTCCRGSSEWSRESDAAGLERSPPLLDAGARPTAEVKR
jgi:hypothetical protein